MPSLRNRQLAAARNFLHSVFCFADACTTDTAADHARRTQHKQARELVDVFAVTYDTYDEQWCDTFHKHLCSHRWAGRECATPDRHALQMASGGLSKSLRETLDEA